MSSSRAASLRSALAERVVIADGAMGSMLQGVDLTLEDFAANFDDIEVPEGRLSEADMSRAVDGFMNAFDTQ